MNNFSRGILLIIACEMAYVAMWAFTKHLGTRYPASEIMMFRMLIALGIALVMIRRKGSFASLHTEVPWMHFWRSLLGTASMFMAIWCIPRLPLGAVSTITQLGPVFIAIMGVVFLGERMRQALLIALTGGLIGALLASGTLAIGLSLAVIVMVISNLLFSAGIIMTRKLVQRDPSTTVVFYASVMAFVVSAGLTAFNFVMPTPADFFLLLGVGVSSGIAQLLITEAHRHAQASELAPFAYSSIVWAFLVGALFWAEYPTLTQLGGAALVVISTLYLWYMNRKQKPA